MSLQSDLYKPTTASAASLRRVNVRLCTCSECLHVKVQGGRVDMYRVGSHLEAWTCRRVLPCWDPPGSVCPIEAHTLSDYMSGLVSPAKQAPGCSCVQWHPILYPAHYQVDRVLLVRLGMITEDSKRLLVSVSTYKCWWCRWGDETGTFSVCPPVDWMCSTESRAAQLCYMCWVLQCPFPLSTWNPPLLVFLFLFSKYSSYTMLNSPGPVLIGSFKYFSCAG